MAGVGPTVPDPRLVRKVWSRDLWKDIAVDRYWSRFMGTGASSPIQVYNDIKGKHAGDTITIPLIYKLENPGVTNCATLEGNEEQMVEDAMTVTIMARRHAVTFPCEFEDWKHLFDLRQKAKEFFRTWWSERDDKEIFNTLAANPTGTPTGWTDLRLADVSAKASTATNGRQQTGDMVLKDIVRLKEMARMARPKIRPVRIDGSEHYILVLHPYVARQLRTSDQWIQIQSTANQRGESNPIFRGALGVYDGVILHEHEYVPITAGTAPAPDVATNLFFGQQAGIWTQSRDVFWRESDYKDYGNQFGVATGMYYGFRTARFDDGYGTDGPQNYGLIRYKTAARVGAFD